MKPTAYHGQHTGGIKCGGYLKIIIIIIHCIVAWLCDEASLPHTDIIPMSGVKHTEDGAGVPASS